MAERHGHKPMTVSNRFRFRVARRGLRRMLVRIRRDGGSSLFEFALVVPVLSVLLVGIVYSGITLYDYVALDYAVSIGVRSVANNRAAGSATPNACSLGETALQQAAVGLNTSSSVLTIDTGPQTETFTRNSTLVGDTNPPSSCTALQAGDTVTMTATYPCNLTIPYAHINLCSVKEGPVSTNVPYWSATSGDTVASTVTGNCPYTNGCIAATATARIE